MDILNDIRKELIKNIDKKYKNNMWGFRYKINAHGVRIPVVRQIAKKYYIKIKHLDKTQLYKISEELLKTNYMEESIIAFSWIYNQRKYFNKADFKIFEKWIKKYIDNWAKCDDFCYHTIGYFILKYPEHIKKTKKWAKSKNRWLRRASAVSLIIPVRKDKKFLKNVFEIANILLLDKDDLVQKGCGWMLKEASNKNKKEVFNFIIKHKKEMPRTSLRYAIEKMPKKLRKKALTK